ncbi:aspartyl protease family protein [Massilia sp. R2A-15]|uniref:aspartyl protease family protein n=1 Tax=Massilia sp. R2A-15 TaxID=3064278 RepID=UPI002733C39C|nr:aspartyl protease family protein [Massilia sp. R2A-15]WLI88440.1 aspartyl protease family protein [Massilia sp. R2A-15]
MPTSFLRGALALALSALLSSNTFAADKAACQYVQIGQLPLRYLGEWFHPAVDGFINGKPAPMMVDTGSNKTWLTNQLAERLDLRQRATGNIVKGVGGETRLYSARVDDFQVGPTHTGKRYFEVIGETGMTPEFDALVGADFLFQADVEISLAEKAVRFFRPTNCSGDSYLAYWGDAVEVPFTGTFFESRNPTFTVELNGVKLNAIIDSGASRSFVFIGGARKAGVNTDSAGVVKVPGASGIGSETLAQWRTVFKTLSIGGEVIRDAELNISADPNTGRQDADLLLGVDFLRSHRVLFAMDQRRLYISYLGGDIFSRDSVAIEPWLQKEADQGNPNAQYALATKYLAGSGAAHDAAAAAVWMDKAAHQGHPRAAYQVGTWMLHSGKSAESAALFRNVLSKHPDEHRAALFLFLAQLQGGDSAGAARDLAAHFADDKQRNWPAPVADFYLGRIDAAQLVALAGKKQANTRFFTCDAKLLVSELAGAQGDKDKAKTLADAWRAECGRPAPNI